MSAQWQSEFTDFTDMPAAITALVAAGELVDISYHNDAMPTFVAKRDVETMDIHGSSENIPVLWVNYADPKNREIEMNGRFYVQVQSEGDVRIETDDILLALAALVQGGAK